MTKNERRELDKAIALADAGHHDMAARILSIIHRSTRRSSARAAALELVLELDLTSRVTMFNGCLVHVDDAPAVRS